MDITPVIPEGKQVIDSYGPGRFQISRTPYEGSVLVLPNQTVPWDVKSFDGLDANAFQPAIDRAAEIEILLIGAGHRMQPLPSALRNELRAAGLGVDIMDTGAACRTYNVLLMEERRVAAALIALPA